MIFLVRLIIKKHPQESVYLSHRNTKTDFPVLTCAVSLGEEKRHMWLSVQDHPELAELDYQISGWNRSKMMKEEKNSQMK